MVVSFNLKAMIIKSRTCLHSSHLSFNFSIPFCKGRTMQKHVIHNLTAAFYFPLFFFPLIIQALLYCKYYLASITIISIWKMFLSQSSWRWRDTERLWYDQGYIFASSQAIFPPQWLVIYLHRLSISSFRLLLSKYIGRHFTSIRK